MLERKNNSWTYAQTYTFMLVSSNAYSQTKTAEGRQQKSKEMHSKIYRMCHKVLGYNTEGHRCYHRGRKLRGHTEENPSRRKYLALGLRLCPGPGSCVLLSTHTQSESNRPASLMSLLESPSSITIVSHGNL